MPFGTSYISKITMALLATVVGSLAIFFLLDPDTAFVLLYSIGTAIMMFFKTIIMMILYGVGYVIAHFFSALINLIIWGYKSLLEIIAALIEGIVNAVRGEMNELLNLGLDEWNAKVPSVLKIPYLKPKMFIGDLKNWYNSSLNDFLRKISEIKNTANEYDIDVPFFERD